MKTMKGQSQAMKYYAGGADMGNKFSKDEYIDIKCSHKGKITEECNNCPINVECFQGRLNER